MIQRLENKIFDKYFNFLHTVGKYFSLNSDLFHSRYGVKIKKNCNMNCKDKQVKIPKYLSINV